MPVKKLLLVFIIIPLIEMIILIKIGQVLGAPLTILSVLGLGILGGFLVRYQGLQVLFQVRNEISRGNLPGNTLLDGLLVLTGGLLLITPGFLTAAAGFLLMFSSTRRPVREFIKKWLNYKLATGRWNFEFKGWY